MTIEQTIEIPPDYQMLLNLPRSIPAGIKVRVAINIPAGTVEGRIASALPPVAIEDVRLLLQQEMAEKGTSGVTAAAGDGWEAHVREYYAES